MTVSAPSSIISLVPNSGLQFIDLHFNIDDLPKLNCSFWEERMESQATADGQVPVMLRCLEANEASGELEDPTTGQTPPVEEIYDLNRQKGLEPFLGKWVPLPYFYVIKPASLMGDPASYDKGPTNWARVRVAELAERDRHNNSHRITLLFDTAIRNREPDRPYVMPSLSDSQEQHEFRLVAEPQYNAWFLNETWTDEWLDELFREFKQAQRPGRKLGPQDFPHACEHWARYLTFIRILADTSEMPRIALIDTVSTNRTYVPIDVDLVLDVGNSRTCGILMESSPNDRLDLSNCYVLGLRDLSQPDFVYDKPFESRVEFARVSFGKDAISRKSGRGNAFAWPSPVRVGPEAVRLAGDALGNEGTTGLSSPKRYLWDEEPQLQGWRFNGVAPDGKANELPVTGPFMAYVTDEGNVLSQLRGNPRPAMSALFSRSSIYTFMLCEILVQAVTMMNAPEVRQNRRHANVPRKLRRVILTMPPATPLQEQAIMRQRAQAAVELTWNLFGWSENSGSVPSRPSLVLNLDEASATQLVYLYTEITQKFQGDATNFFALLGKSRNGATAPSLRVASLDIGGGTTDLIVTTYTVEGGRAINPEQNFREGFRIAGDDILAAMIDSVIFPQLRDQLREAGVRDPSALLAKLFAGDRGDLTEPERHLRRQFVNLVLVPASLGLLGAYESVAMGQQGELFRRPLGSFTSPGVIVPDRVMRFIEEAAADAGALAFRVADVELVANVRQIEDTVRGVIGQILGDYCEVIHAYDCDVVLLSGRPSRLPAVQAAIMGKMPVPTDRIVPMHRYLVGPWYPFRSPTGRVDDPKTTAAVGAVLCAMAEGHLESFLLRVSKLKMRSTARFIGEMEISGQILNNKIHLKNVDLDVKKKRGVDESFQLKFYGPIFIGFRQLPLERWPATPLYHMKFSNPDTASKMALPLTVTVARMDSEDGAEENKERFVIEDVTGANDDNMRPTDVTLRFQTLKSEAGYWLDTGVCVGH